MIITAMIIIRSCNSPAFTSLSAADNWFRANPCPWLYSRAGGSQTSPRELFLGLYLFFTFSEEKKNPTADSSSILPHWTLQDLLPAKTKGPGEGDQVGSYVLGGV